MQQPCNKCGGKGKTFAKQCPHCKGKKVVMENKHLTVDVEKGMKNGDQILFAKEGEQVPDMVQGDIIFVLQMKKHPMFKRVGDNLYMDMEISLQEALLGFKRTIKHLDGHKVEF